MTYFFPHQPCPFQHLLLFSPHFLYLTILTFQNEAALWIHFLVGDLNHGFPTALSAKYLNENIQILPPHIPHP